MKDTEQLKIKENPRHADYIKNLEETVKVEIDKKKILSYIRHKKVEKEKYLKLSDFIEYLTDFYLCVQLDQIILVDEMERIKM